MAGEPDNLTHVILREMRAEMRPEFARLDGALHEVRRHVSSLDLRVEALDEKFELSREATVSVVGYAANASRAHVDLYRRSADLTKRSEKLGAQS